jgi:DNA mismatch endonuclease (patch repair protein)
MSRIRSVSNAERASKSFCEARAGCRLTHQAEDLLGRPDFVNRRLKIAVFFHGCFFHKHWHVKVPKTNTRFWLDKFERNRLRHLKVSRRLRAEGWSVLTVWECEAKR